MTSNFALLPSGENSHFNFAGSQFATYCQNMREIVSQSRVDLLPANHEKIVDANTPHEYLPEHYNGQHAVLMVHGLFDCPYTMHALGQYFQQHGILARSVLLPGHGTRPGDLLHVHYEDWFKAVQFGHYSLNEQAEHISLLGLSTGASCAIALAQQGMAVHRLIAIAPAIKLKSPLALLTPLLNHFSQRKWLPPWFSVQDELDYTKYASICYNAVFQIYQLVKLINQQKQQNELSMPLLFVLSQQDEVISTPAALRFVQCQTNLHNQIYLYSRDKFKPSASNVQVVPSQFPEYKVLDLAHCALTFASDDPHYGFRSHYRDFHHYQNKLCRLFRRKNDESYEFGAINLHNLRKGNLARATFNPDFSNMAKRIVEFIVRK